jgi:hypothetical protein
MNVTEYFILILRAESLGQKFRRQDSGAIYHYYVSYPKQKHEKTPVDAVGQVYRFFYDAVERKL